MNGYSTEDTCGPDCGNGFVFTLFGRFNGRYASSAPICPDRGKTQDLLCYLLVNRSRSHHREDLGAQFWGDFTTTQSKKYLRQTLWQLQKSLDQVSPEGPRLLTVEPEWVHLNSEAERWLDIETFENNFANARNLQSGELGAIELRRLRESVDLYAGQLLQGWYHEWCVFDADRLEAMYLTVLDKLMDHCEATHDYGGGIEFGNRVLRCDRAREVTHRRLIKLLYLGGDRTAALHQYRKCVTALKEALGVLPSSSTEELHDHVRADRWEDVLANLAGATPLHKTMDRLAQVQSALCQMQTMVKDEIGALERLIQPVR